MSNNANKFNKPKKSKHNSPCNYTPKKTRFRDTKEAKRSLTGHRYKRREELATSGTTTHNQDRYYQCPGCKGYHLTSKVPGKTKDFVLGA